MHTNLAPPFPLCDSVSSVVHPSDADDADNTEKHGF